jgi:hypothetical protein
MSTLETGIPRLVIFVKSSDETIHFIYPLKFESQSNGSHRIVISNEMDQHE